MRINVYNLMSSKLLQILFVLSVTISCIKMESVCEERNDVPLVLTKSVSGYAMAGSVLEAVDEHSNINNEWGARIDLVQGQDVSYSGFVNISTSYNRDFFTYDPVSGKLTFKGETGRWNIRYYQDYDYMWIYPSDSLSCLYILGNGKVSAPSWIPTVGSPQSGFYNYNVPYCCVAPKISEGSYQSTIYLSDDNEWKDVRLEIYSDNIWNKDNLLLTPQSLFGPDASKFTVLQAGTATCNIYTTSSFVAGYYRFVVFPSAQTPKVYIEKVESCDYSSPALNGKLIFHRYSSYMAEDSDIFLYDFADDTLINISENWTNVRHSMNAHFSSDGQSVVFMGISTEDSWDIFKYDFTEDQPTNITPSSSAYRDEDPKFSYDGTKVIFKRNGNLAVLNLSDNTIDVLTNRTSDMEYSMPYYSVDGTQALFGFRSSSGDGLGIWDFSTSSSSILYDKVNISEYYPITVDALSFYFAANYSASNLHDQIYKGFWNGDDAISLGFNVPSADYSDPCNVLSDWTVFSSTASSSLNDSYDLYLGNNKTGVTYSLVYYNPAINTSLNELGADYHAN